MDLSDKINPADVLSHLNQLGYKNITPQQLKEFIKDLKKLIVYDQLSPSSSSGSFTSLSTSVTSDSEFCSSSDSSTDDSKALSRKCESTKSGPQGLSVHMKEKKLNKSNQVPPRTTTSVRSGSMLRSSTSTSSISGKTSIKENVPLGRGKPVSASEENLQEAVKPKTSFIRPWQLQGMPSGSRRTAASDPVSRHQFYQNMWAKHKCPGEDSRADLRWVIREKMLGQDPHLYSKNVAAKPNRLRV